MKSSGQSRWALLVMLCPLVLLAGCDPQKQALQLFANQGLNLLEPARDYIKLGGIFVLPKQGRTAYLDPYDSLTGAGGTASNIKEIIEQQAESSSADAAVILGTLGGLIPIPAGLKFTHGTQLQLGQIDASGTRYTSQMMEALLRKPATDAAIRGQLAAGNRVFLVQEVLSAKSMSLKTSSGNGIAASIEDGATIPNCGSTTTGPAAASSSSGGSGNGSSGTVAKANSSNNAGAGGSPKGTPASLGQAGKGSSSSGPSNPARTTGAASGTQKPASGGQGATGVSVGVCVANQYTLSFKTDHAIPFAVRLNEVVLGPGDLPEIKVTGFQPPTNGLGEGDESASWLVNPQRPVLRDVRYLRH